MVLFIFGALIIQKRYGTCKKRSKVSLRSKVRGSYGNTKEQPLTLDLMGTMRLFFASSVASLGELCTKKEQNGVCKPELFLQLSFSSFFCRKRFDDSKPFYEKTMLEALTVVVDF
jgi:hypothetical protein